MTLIALNSLTKKYPGVIANDDITFDIDKGEIHALLGENGAGKSTLVKIIYGLVQPDYGMMRLEGKGFTPATANSKTCWYSNGTSTFLTF